MEYKTFTWNKLVKYLPQKVGKDFVVLLLEESPGAVDGF